MMFFRWLSLSLSLFYVMFENLVVAHAVQYAKPMCAVSQPQRPGGATCVSCASSAKWNCHQTTPEVFENLVLFREHNRVYFKSEQQHGSHDTLSQSQESEISITGLHLTPRNNYGISDQILT